MQPAKQLTPNEVRTGAARVAPTTKKKIKRLDTIPTFLKIMLFGDSGTGKTYILAQLLEVGYRILVLDSDVGGDGLNTVRSYLKSRGKLEMMRNCLVLPIENYNDAKDFVSNPEKTFNSWVDGTTWAEFNPDWLVWDGFGNFQQVHIWDHALEFDGGSKETEQRKEGVALETKDWQTVLKATHFAVNDFGHISKADGSPINKIWSAHIDEREVDPSGKKINQADAQQRDRLVKGNKPLLSGRGAKLVIGAADYCIRTFTKVKTGGRISYCWDMSPLGDMNSGKVRGVPLSGGPILEDVNPIERIKEMLDNIKID